MQYNYISTMFIGEDSNCITVIEICSVCHKSNIIFLSMNSKLLKYIVFLRVAMLEQSNKIALNLAILLVFFGVL